MNQSNQIKGWVKASERLPVEEKQYSCRWTEDKTPFGSWFLAEDGIKYFRSAGLSNHKHMEWLDESVQSGEERWISVKDDLPKKDGNSEIFCLVNDTYNGVVVRPFNEHHHCWDQEDAADYYTDAVGGKITHWQAIPKPPSLLSSEQKVNKEK